MSYLLKAEQGFDLPRSMQIEFTRVIQHITDDTGKEITGQEIFNEFAAEYLDPHHPYRLDGYEAAQNPHGDDKTLLTARVSIDGEPAVVQGSGNGSLEAFVNGLRDRTGLTLRVLDYHEHAKGTGVDAAAVAYVEAKIGDLEIWGCGMHTDITTASMRAIVSAMNRAAALG